MTEVAATSGPVRGAHLAIARIGAGVSQAALARELGVDQSVVSRWENAAYPTEAARRRYAEALARLAGMDFNG